LLARLVCRARCRAWSLEPDHETDFRRMSRMAVLP